MRDRERERQRHRQREKQPPCRKPDMGLDPGSPGSHPGLKAGAKQLSHPGIPMAQRLIICSCLHGKYQWWFVDLDQPDSKACTFNCHVIISPGIHAVQLMRRRNSLYLLQNWGKATRWNAWEECWRIRRVKEGAEYILNRRNRRSKSQKY